MATVRAQRFLNNVLNGTVGAGSLQTALGDSPTRADWQQVTSERGKARVIAAITNGANAVGGSATAIEDYISSVVGPTEMLRNSNKFGKSQIGTTVGASNSLMSTWTANQNLLSVSQKSVLGKDIYTSPFVGNYSKKIIDAKGSGNTWNVFLPFFDALPPFTGSASLGSDFAINDDESIFLYLGTGFSFDTPCLRRSTDMGATFSSPTSITGSTSVSVRSMDFGEGVFVVVGDAGRIFSSVDGITWTQRTSGHGNPLHRVVYDNNIFVAAGQNNLMTSVDGITWINRDSGPGAKCNCINFVGNNTWLAGFEASSLRRSTNNGVSWSSVNLAGGKPRAMTFASDGTGHVLGGHNVSSLTFSLDHGATWTNIGSVTGLSGNNIDGIVFYAGSYLLKSINNANLSVSVKDQPTVMNSLNFANTDGQVVSANGYNMLGQNFNDPLGDIFAVKKGRLFVKTNTPFMFYRGQ